MIRVEDYAAKFPHCVQNALLCLDGSFLLLH
jgi:hypothetical protein